jgi:DHA1 family multidrug resistance protein-like MFS transporter
MKDIIRDSTVGQILNYLSEGRILPYPEQQPGYIIPAKYLATPLQSPSGTLCGDLPAAPISKATTLVEAEGVLSEKKTDSALEKGDSKEEVFPTAPAYPYLVDWESDDDQDNPR